MALRKAEGNIPSNVVVMTEDEALNSQWEMIYKWVPKSDVWPLCYAPAVTATATAFSSIFINAYYRNKLMLRNFGKFSSYLPTVVIPTLVSSVFHQQFVTADILMEKTVCPVCLQMRAVCIQTLTATVYPAALASFAAFMFATRHYTYNLPPVTKPMENFKLWLQLTKPIGKKLSLIALSQALITVGITHLEAGSYFKVRTKLLETEKLLDSGSTFDE